MTRWGKRAPLVGLAMVVLSGCTGPGVAEDRSLSPPTPVSTSAKVVFRGTGYEWAKAMSACLSNEGFTVVPPHPGESLYRMRGSGQATAFGAAQERCQAKIGARWTPALTDENITIMYETDLLVAKCLRTRGVQVDEPVPTLEAYKAQVRGQGRPEDAWVAAAHLTYNERSPDPTYFDKIAACNFDTLQVTPWAG